MDIKKALFINKTKYAKFYLNNNDNWLDIIADYLKKGYKVIELNIGSLDDNIFLDIAKKVRQLTSIYEALLIIANRADIAKLVKADGIIIDNASMGFNDVKKIVDSETLIGFNTVNCDFSFDFYLTDNDNDNAVSIPCYHKIEAKNGIITYNLGEYDYN